MPPLNSMKWLFATTRFPWPIADGHWLRVYHLARTLVATGDRAAILSYPGDITGKAAYAAARVDVLPFVEEAPIERGRGRVALAPFAFDSRLATAVAQYAADFDVVVLSGARMLQYSPEAERAGNVIADLIDDPVLEYARRPYQIFEWRPWLRAVKNRIGRPRYERYFLPHVDAVTFVSESDCKSFRNRHPHSRITCVPNGVDASYFVRPSHPKDNVPDAHVRVVFAGYMGNPNNEKAASFLVEEVGPLLWTALPYTTVQLVGAEPTDTVKRLAAERVEVTGPVNDIRPYLWAATVVAVPMQSGTGIKNKVLEAWATGAAVVATSLACQGLPAEHGRNILVADSPQAFAQCLGQVIADAGLRHQLGAEARQTVVTRCSWEHAVNALRRVLIPE